MLIQDRVLVFDRETETADVLRAVLEPRGVSVSQVKTRQQDAIESQKSRPAVLVIDLEQSPLSGPHLGQQECLSDCVADAWQNVPRVVIGQISLENSEPERSPAGLDSATGTLAGRSLQRRLMKPFHYGDLIGAIEQLLAESPSI